MDFRNMIFPVIAAVVIAVVVVVYVMDGHAQSKTATSSPSTIGASVQTQQQSQQQSNATLFSSTQYYQYSYLISSPTLSGAAKSAVTGFNVTRSVLSNGSTEVQFMQYGTNNSAGAYIVPNGDSLYYIDGSFGDDSPPTGEYSMGDDGIVLINSSGYVVKG
ncbi:MAG: hypothetical protein M1504_00250 [Candidatus Marsarchaeota archaeon]|nr:hypothetical protein [Candidatus Marsarchaeota archaeon]